jgi:hypothetical protein
MSGDAVLWMLAPVTLGWPKATLLSALYILKVSGDVVSAIFMCIAIAGLSSRYLIVNSRYDRKLSGIQVRLLVESGLRRCDFP